MPSLNLRGPEMASLALKVTAPWAGGSTDTWAWRDSCPFPARPDGETWGWTSLLGWQEVGSGGMGLVPSLGVTGEPFFTEMSAEKEEGTRGQQAGDRPGQSPHTDSDQGDQASPEFQPESPRPDFVSLFIHPTALYSHGPDTILGTGVRPTKEIHLGPCSCGASNALVVWKKRLQRNGLAEPL